MTYVMTTNSPRDRMVESTALLIREHGVAGTGMREIAEHAHAPRGSLQHYFPAGKDQAVTEALAWVAEQISAPLIKVAAADRAVPARVVVAKIFSRWHRILTESDYLAGCPLVADGHRRRGQRRASRRCGAGLRPLARQPRHRPASRRGRQGTVPADRGAHDEFSRGRGRAVPGAAGHRAVGRGCPGDGPPGHEPDKAVALRRSVPRPDPAPARPGGRTPRGTRSAVF